MHKQDFNTIEVTQRRMCHSWSNRRDCYSLEVTQMRLSHAWKYTDENIIALNLQELYFDTFDVTAMW